MKWLSSCGHAPGTDINATNSRAYWGFAPSMLQLLQSAVIPSLTELTSSAWRVSATFWTPLFSLHLSIKQK